VNRNVAFAILFASMLAGAFPAAGETEARPSFGRGAEVREDFDVVAVIGPRLDRSARYETNVRLEIEFPQDGAVISDSACGAFVTGRAIAHHVDLRRFDVVLVIDTSRSTVDPTGVDINGNGIVGKPRPRRIGSTFDVGSTDPGDSILAAEVAAARQLLRGLDPRNTRVGVVRFAGELQQSGGGIFDRPPGRPAVTVEPLTNDYSRVEMALNDVLIDEPSGQTHIGAGIEQATIELAGLPGALSTEDPDSEKVVFFFTDGQPTLPYGSTSEADNVRAVLSATSRASRMQIRIHSFAIGAEALEGPIATLEMANRTNGYFTPVRRPGDLTEVVEDASFANLSEVRVHNKTTEADADPFRTAADGSWGGLIELQPGANEIEITARADDGAEALRTIALRASGDLPGRPEARSREGRERTQRSDPPRARDGDRTRAPRGPRPRRRAAQAAPARGRRRRRRRAVASGHGPSRGSEWGRSLHGI
jgi:hypothetical protein